MKQPGLHVAIIMDGNGRWATRRGLPRVAGHRAGVASVRRVVERSLDCGVTRLTLYAFSSDNWRRPQEEVQSIFWLLRAFLRLEANRLRERGVRVQAIGRRDRLPHAALKAISDAELITVDGEKLALYIAIDYSSREQIIRAATAGKCMRECMEQSADVDLLIRTGGEQRLSDFLLWECAYAELLFTERMWPDFDENDFESALATFSRRERRFGGVPQVPAFSM
jgi:undecaprenyl diphosphate synthase